MEVEDFSNWLFAEGKAAKTIESYVNDVKGFQSYLREKLKDVPVLSRFSFVRYKEHLMKEDYAVSTINKKINSLKVYKDFLRTKGIISESFIQLKRDRIKIAAGSEDNVDALSDEQVEQLLFYVENRSNGSKETINLTNFNPAATDTVDTASGLSIDLEDALSSANAGQSFSVAITGMTSAVGASGIRIDSQADANSAITTINSAIETVSAERSKLGAFQNRLEHTINNLVTSSENLTAAESRVRDVDYALAA